MVEALNNNKLVLTKLEAPIEDYFSISGGRYVGLLSWQGGKKYEYILNEDISKSEVYLRMEVETEGYVFPLIALIGYDNT